MRRRDMDGPAAVVGIDDPVTTVGKLGEGGRLPGAGHTGHEHGRSTRERDHDRSFSLAVRSLAESAASRTACGTALNRPDSWEDVLSMAGLGRTIPALPVRDIAAAVAHFRDRLGFTALHVDDGFAVVEREDARIHLWQASDTSWSRREDLHERPVVSGAESFIAGTASCRIETADIDALYAELAAADVLHSVSREGLRQTDFGTREFATLDADGNLIEFFRWNPA